MLSDQEIKNVAALSSTYTKGYQYFKEGLVKNLQYDCDNKVFEAHVYGNRRYNVSIEFDRNNEIDDYECSCPAYDEYYGACKHVVAVLKSIQSRWNFFFGVTNNMAEKRIAKKGFDIQNAIPIVNAPKRIPFSNSTKALFDYFNNINLDNTAKNSESRTVNTRIVPTYVFSIYSGRKQSWLEFSIGNDKLYVMKSVKSFVEAAINTSPISYGKNFDFIPNEAVYDENSKELLNLLKDTLLEEQNMSGWSYYSSSYYNSAFTDNRTFKLSNTNLLKFFEIMKNDPFNITINGTKLYNIQVTEERPNFKLDVLRIDGGIKAELDLEDDVYYGLDANYNYIYHKHMIYKVDPLFSSYVEPLMKCFADNGRAHILIPDTQVQGFFSSVVPSIEKIAAINLEPSLIETYYRENLEKQVYFDKYGDGISAKVYFKYEDISINPVDGWANKNIIHDGKTLLRDVQEENKLLAIFKKYGFQTTREMYVQKDADKTYDFLREGLSEIRELSEAFYSDDFNNISIKNTGKISAGVRVNTGSGLLEMNMQYEDITPKELMELLASYKLKKKYHRLKTGHFIPLDSSEFQAAANLIDQLNLSQSDITKKVFELPRYRAMYIDSMAREKTDLHIERSSAFKKMVQDISEPQDMEFQLPEGIMGKLRDYQKIGFKWLKTLSYYGFGGILADDMGLGKTLQVIVLIKSEKEDAQRGSPCLVVAPTSLVYNWQDEVRKFAPDLTVTVLSGTQETRRERFNEISNSDIVVTSYGMIKRDIELYEKIKFKYCFIDEAQHIKNPNTLNAKSVKQIKASGYFALTGTPVENTLTELWSIFDFIMPGYLLSHNKFTTRFETPIVKNGDKDILKELGRHIKPFIMRRMKKDVLKELPEKIESKMTNEMTGEQKKAYSAYMMKAKKEFEQELIANGFENSRIKILSILTRMRQICCHPGLFIENYTGGSGKLEMLMELLEDAVDGGHRILVFSQFTSMLSLIKNELDKENIKYHYLDGSTPAEERIRLVNAFNGGDKDLFLISLKAGGTGLNLTGADMVVHYDPWWNPAVEDQATDRAYRIGQKNAVQVFKMITKDTIEEKIYELQQKKKELIDAVIKPGENFLTKMTEAEIRKLFDVG